MTGHKFSYNHGEHVEGTANYAVEIRVDKDANITDTVGAFRAYLLACRYHPDSVKDALGDE